MSDRSFVSEVSSTRVVNCTFSGNRPQGGSIGLEATGMDLINTVILGDVTRNRFNMLEPAVPFAYFETSTLFLSDPPPGIITVSHSLLESMNPVGAGNVDGTGVLPEDVFNSPVHAENAPNLLGDYRLLANSPARNAGLGSANMQDFDLSGAPRVEGVIDIGAREYVAVIVSGPIAEDDDGDGVDNGVEEAIGTLPDVADRDNHRHLDYQDGMLVFGVDPTRTGDYILELRRSDDLVSFPTVVATNEMMNFITTVQGLVEVDDPVPVVDGKVFYRLEVRER